MLRRRQKVRVLIGDLRDKDGDLKTEAQEKASILNDFVFISVHS